MVALTTLAPRFEGFHTQVAVIGLVPEVERFMQLGIRALFALKSTLPAIETFAVIVTVVLNAGELEKLMDVTEPMVRPSIASKRLALI
jgi:hypothetical protein